MKYFLLNAVQRDGEHETYEQVILRAPDYDTAKANGQTICERQFTYGDGLTAIYFKYANQIPAAHAKILDKYNAAQIVELSTKK